MTNNIVNNLKKRENMMIKLSISRTYGAIIKYILKTLPKNLSNS